MRAHPITAADVGWAHSYVAKIWRKHPHLTDDIKAEAVVGLWDAARVYRPSDEHSDFRAFAGRRVWGQAIDFLRRTAGRGATGRVSILHVSDRQWERFSTFTDVDAKIDRRRELDALSAEIDRLPARTASVLRARFFEHRGQREIARDLDLTESRICQIVTRSAKALAATESIRALRRAA